MFLSPRVGPSPFLFIALPALLAGCAADHAVPAADASFSDGDAAADGGRDADASVDGSNPQGDAATVLVCGKPCTPRTCVDFPGPRCLAQPFNDGCGGTIQCSPNLVCGAGSLCCSVGACFVPPDGGALVCPPSCLPLTCATLGPDTCGPTGDGCGGLLDCGACPGGKPCVSGQCGACPPDGG